MTVALYSPLEASMGSMTILTISSFRFTLISSVHRLHLHPYQIALATLHLKNRWEQSLNLFIAQIIQGVHASHSLGKQIFGRRTFAPILHKNILLLSCALSFQILDHSTAFWLVFGRAWARIVS